MGGGFRDGGPRMGGGPRFDGPRMRAEPRSGGGPRFEHSPRRGFGGVPMARDRDRHVVPDRRPPPRFDRERRRHAAPHRRRRGVWRPGYVWGGIWIAPGIYYAECEWLRRRAITTDSTYWWRRYRQCVALDYS